MLALVNGDYAAKGNGLAAVSGKEAVLQRVLMKLTVAATVEGTQLTAEVTLQ